MSKQTLDTTSFAKDNLPMAPQLNPFGIAGNKEAIKRLQWNKPLRPPKRNNPFMNPEIIEYGQHQRYRASEPTCDKKCKDEFYKCLFRSPEDLIWNRQASERQFYTVPNTSIPPDTVKFAMWLYGNNYVGKSGSIYDRYGYRVTPDSLMNMGENAASPQNGGQVNNNFGLPYVPGAASYVNSYQFDSRNALPMGDPSYRTFIDSKQTGKLTIPTGVVSSTLTPPS